MTWFEDFAYRLGVLERNEKGQYTGYCLKLYKICVDITLSDNNEIRNLSKKKQEKMIESIFYEQYPEVKEKRENTKYKISAKVCGEDGDLIWSAVQPSLNYEAAKIYLKACMSENTKNELLNYGGKFEVVVAPLSE